MNRVYITAIPLQGKSDLETLIYAADWVKKENVIETRFPIVQVMVETAKEKDSIQILAIRQENADTDRNFSFFQRELKERGFSTALIKEITLPENQNTANLLNLLQKIVEELPTEARVYACITYGTKSIPIITMASLNCAEKMNPEMEIGGIYYGEVQRENGEIKSSNLCDLTALYQLSTIVSQMNSSENAEDMFNHLMWMNDHSQEGNKNEVL